MRVFLCERDLFENPQQVAGKTGGLKRVVPKRKQA